MKMKYILPSLLILLLLSWSCQKNRTLSEPDPSVNQIYGLQVGSAGELLLNGVPFRGVGVNYFNAFYRVLLSANWMDTTYRPGFRYLSSQDIPFIRFMASGFWPVDWNIYLSNKIHYFRRLDEFVRDAEETGIGLIPSLFWNQTTISDLMGEPRNQWGNPESKTIAFMRSYTSEVVERYKDSPAIWGWEFGNEFNNTADINYTQVTPEKGTPVQRTPADRISTSCMVTALKEFAEEVRKHDPNRIILTGHSRPRQSAWHLMNNGTWDKDSVFQYQLMLSLQNPDPVNTFTIHLYPSAEGQYFAGDTASLKEILQYSINQAAKSHKPLFLGEFGAPLNLGETEEKSKFFELMNAIEESEVPLAAVWVFDYSQQNDDWNITRYNRRCYMIEAIGELNRRLR